MAGPGAAATPPPEQVAARNAAAVACGFAVVRGIRHLRRRGGGVLKDPAAPSPAGSPRRLAAPPAPAPPDYTKWRVWPPDPPPSGGPWDETWRTAVAAGLTTELFGRVGRHSGSPALAAVVSSLPMRFLTRDRSFQFNYDFIAAYVAAQVIMNAVPFLKRRPVLTMMLSASQLLSTWILTPEHLPLPYVKFLRGQGKCTAETYDRLAGIFSGRCMRTCGDAMDLCFQFKEGEALTTTYGGGAAGLHKAAAVWWWRHFREAVPFYVKVYLLRAVVKLLARGKGAAKALATVLTVSPAPQIRGGASFVFDVLRSSSFLSLYCCLSWYSIGVMGLVMPNTLARPALLQAAWLLPGAAIAVESASQKATIANYCATFALYPVLSGQFGRSSAQRLGGFGGWVAATSVLCATGRVKTPMLLSLLWPPLPAPSAAPVR